MGFRFGKRKKIMPGVTLNVSKSGVGVRVGGKHAGVSVGPSGTRASASIPGTGLSYSKQLGSRTRTAGVHDDDFDPAEMLFEHQAKPKPDGLLGAIVMFPIGAIGFFASAALGGALLFSPYWIAGICLLLASLLPGRIAWRAYRVFKPRTT